MALCGDRLYSGRRTGIARSFTFRNTVQTLHFVQCTSANGAFAYLRFLGGELKNGKRCPLFRIPHSVIWQRFRYVKVKATAKPEFGTATAPAVVWQLAEVGRDMRVNT